MVPVLPPCLFSPIPINSKQSGHQYINIRPQLVLTLQRGVMSAAHHSENITCRGVTSTACHAALSHSFDYISTTLGENVIGLLCTCSRRSWLSYGVGESSYKLLLHFFSPLKVWVFFLQSLISQAALWVSGTSKLNMKRMLLLSSRS